MTKRTELVKLIEQHLRYTPEERAQVVHCRCGSRLPWMACHGGAGVGQQQQQPPPHYHVSAEDGVVYRVSPLARCPCNATARTYYECCWTDPSSLAYLVDATGRPLRLHPVARGLGQSDAFFQAKSRLRSMDPVVYHGCVERLKAENEFFTWTDLHWHLEEPELLRQSQAWNKALEAYCDDKGFVGEERARVVAKHTANPCAPCGRVGCDAFETEPKEFPRCSRCKAIAYCGRECQTMAWAEHRKVCGKTL
jgi:MYND finger